MLDAIPLWAWCIAPVPSLVILAAVAWRRRADRRECELTQRSLRDERKQREAAQEAAYSKARTDYYIMRLKLLEVGIVGLQDNVSADAAAKRNTRRA